MVWSHELDTPIVVVGALAAIACALVGNFLVLRRLSMMGDAISHAVLPGLAIAFLVTESRDGVWMFVGAAVVGVLTAVFTQWVNSFGKVEEGASMGVVFTALFALGLVLIVRAADHVDLDAECVLYGDIVLAALDTTTLWGMTIPREAIPLSIILLIDLAVLVVFFKEFRITAFDPSLSTTLGINSNVMHYLLMVLVAITSVAAFEAVGSILVIAMLIVPGATAILLTDRLWLMMVLSAVIAVMSAVMGHWSAITMPMWFGVDDVSTSGMMAVVSGVLFALAFLAAPQYGLVSRSVHRMRLAVRIAREDVLGLLFRLEERRAAGDVGTVRAALGRVHGLGPVLRGVTIGGLVRSGMISRDASRLDLTEPGREAARRVVRSHRLWESYLEKHMQVPAGHVHGSAERLEHVTSDALRESLDAQLERPTHDPEGKPIPRHDD